LLCGESSYKSNNNLGLNKQLKLVLIITFATILLITVNFLVFYQPVHAQAQEAPSQVLIKNVNVFDGTSEKLAMGQDVLVEGNLIKKIGKGLKAGNARLKDRERRRTV